jgi:hypothetical protein
MKIVTSHICPPIPIRSVDWCAWYDGQEETGFCGYGATEEEAVASLRDGHELDMLHILFPTLRLEDQVIRNPDYTKVIWVHEGDQHIGTVLVDGDHHAAYRVKFNQVTHQRHFADLQAAVEYAASTGEKT